MLDEYPEVLTECYYIKRDSKHSTSWENCTKKVLALNARQARKGSALSYLKLSWEEVYYCVWVNHSLHTLYM